MEKSQEELVQRIIDANTQIPAKGCRAQHATHGGHHRATFEVHELNGEVAELAEGVLSRAATYPAIVRYSNGKEHDPSEADVHGMAIKVYAEEGARLLADPDEPRAIDFILIDVDTFFSKSLSDYASINEKLVPLLQRKQKSDDKFSFWEAFSVPSFRCALQTMHCVCSGFAERKNPLEKSLGGIWSIQAPRPTS